MIFCGEYIFEEAVSLILLLFSTINSVRKEAIPILHYFCIKKSCRTKGEFVDERTRKSNGTIGKGKY